MKFLKGQISFPNLLVLLGIMIIFIAFLPVINNFITQYGIPAVLSFNADEPLKDLLVALMQLFPIVLAISIILTALYYAIPRWER